jgi:4-amino-4-deoxy-L-arabinose transferase
MLSKADSETSIRTGRDLALILVWAAMIAFAFQGSRGLYESTEGRYAEAGREMLETGNWLIPQLDYHPHWAKPPVTYWAIAGGMALLGQNEWGVRLCNALAFIAIVWAVARLGTLLWDKRTGVAASLIYAVSPYAVYAASSVQTDVLLSLAQILVVVCYFEATKYPEARSGRRWVVLLWLVAGVAFLIKGPPSLLTPVAIMAYHFYRRRRGLPRVQLLSLPGALCFVGVGLSWFLLVIVETPGLLSYYLHDEVAGRIFTAQAHRNPEWYGPFIIYLPVLLFGTGPIAILWFVLGKRHAPLVRWFAFKRLFLTNDRASFLTLWLAIPVVVLSLAKSRLPLYLLPFFPAIALATARTLLLVCDFPKLSRRLWSMGLAMGIVLIAAKAALPFVPTKADMRPFHSECMQTWGPDADYYVHDSTKQYGLQFYLNGRLTRLWDRLPPPTGEQDARTVLARLKTSPEHKTCVFIETSRGHEDDLAALLDKTGFKYEPRRSKAGFAIFVVHLNETQPKPG